LPLRHVELSSRIPSLRNGVWKPVWPRIFGELVTDAWKLIALAVSGLRHGDPGSLFQGLGQRALSEPGRGHHDG
jgi:hypothetical protein